MSLLAYLVDDEPLAIDRLVRLLNETGRVTVTGKSTSPTSAQSFLAANRVDVLFLDISMPAMTGFELLASLASPPNVVFTTAHDEHALQAFRANAIDYLLKPVDASQLARALDKIERLAGQPVSTSELRRALSELALSMKDRQPDYPARIASRLGGKVCFVDLGKVSYFYADDKLTYAVADGRTYTVDDTLTALEERLNPKKFVRIHRTAVINIDWVKELVATPSGGLAIRLNGVPTMELAIARARGAEVKKRLGL